MSIFLYCRCRNKKKITLSIYYCFDCRQEKNPSSFEDFVSRGRGFSSYIIDCFLAFCKKKKSRLTSDVETPILFLVREYYNTFFNVFAFFSIVHHFADINVSVVSAP